MVDMRIELIFVPVSDIDRARDFYAGIGWNLDFDQSPSDDIRFVQMTPPTSACSIAFGRGLSEGEPETEFQAGLRQFSVLLVQVAAVLTVSIFAINLLLHRPLLEALLFSLAIAVGITPQLLPAVVSTSLAAGSQRLAQRKVLVKRLVCIEDLGNIQVLFTDKTGTLTDGQISLTRSIGTDGRPQLRQVRLGPVDGSRVEVLAGLDRGERVALDPQAAARVR